MELYFQVDRINEDASLRQLGRRTLRDLEAPNEAQARHREHNLRPLLEALQSQPRTPVRQGMIKDLVRFHFNEAFAGDEEATGNMSVPRQNEPASPEVVAIVEEFFAQNSSGAASNEHESDWLYALSSMTHHLLGW